MYDLSDLAATDDANTEDRPLIAVVSVGQVGQTIADWRHCIYAAHNAELQDPKHSEGMLL